MPKLTLLRPRIATLDTRRVQPPPKTVDPYLLTPEHRAWAADVVAKANGYCQDPRCKTPNRKPSRLFADHIIERQDGGALTDPANGLARCGSCHTRKTAQARAARMHST